MNKVDESDVKFVDYRTEPLVTFAFDDGTTDDVDVFKPVFVSEGVPGSICVITSQMNVVDEYGMRHLNATELKELKELGWTVASHTHNHADLATLTTDEEIDTELKTSHDILKGLGLDYDIIVYPKGSVDDNVVKIARRYYKIGLDIARNKANYPPNINNMLISRQSGLSQPSTTIADCKAAIDAAINTGNWVIFEDHAQYGFYNNPDNVELLRQLIQYIKSKGIRIVNLRDGFNMKANIVDVGELSDPYYMRIAKNGQIISQQFNGAYYEMKKDTTITNTTPISSFPRRVTEIPFSNAEATSSAFPENKGGTLITHRQSYDSGDNFAYQIYVIYNSYSMYKRRWNYQSGVWDAWDRIDSMGKMSTPNQYTASTAITSFPSNQITITKITSAVTGFPLSSSGILETYYYDTAGLKYNYQIYKPQGINRFYMRHWDTTNSVWTEWITLGEMLPLYTDATLPVASSSNQGRMIFIQKSAGTQDTIMVCVRQSDSNYAWKTVSLT
jgi:peptidoglycan/xylan/chitin deacetylase (PgdA/CDA1 family)